MLARRLNEIDELTKFANDAESFLNNVISDFGWTTECLKEADMVACPVSSNHRMPCSSLLKHAESCGSNHAEPDSHQEDALPSSNFYYTKSTSVVPVLIDKVLQQEILTAAASKNPFDKTIRTEPLDVPPNVDRCVTDLTREERLAIYDYVVQKGKATNKPLSFSVDDLQMSFETKPTAEPESKSHWQILADMRDYKRRRQSYRAKNVHITKKSYTEVMKEVIGNHTRVLEQLAEPKIKKEPRSPAESDIEDERKHEKEKYSSDSSPKRKSKRSKKHRSSSHRDHKHKPHKEHRSKRNHSPSRSRR